MRSVGTSPTVRPLTAPFSMATMECGSRRTSCSTTSQSGPNISARPRTMGSSACMRASSGCLSKRPSRRASLVAPRVHGGRGGLARRPLAPRAVHCLDTRYTPANGGLSKKVGRLPEKVATGRRLSGASPSRTSCGGRRSQAGPASRSQRLAGRSASVTVSSCVLPSRSTVTVTVSPGFLVPRIGDQVVGRLDLGVVDLDDDVAADGELLALDGDRLVAALDAGLVRRAAGRDLLDEGAAL